MWAVTEPCRLESTIIQTNPPTLIVAASDVLHRFRQNDLIAEILGQIDEESLVSTLLENMSFQHEAPLLMRAAAWELAEDLTWGDKHEELAVCIERLARELFENLIAVGAYQRGYLFYQFLKFWGTDLLMANFETMERLGRERLGEV